MKMAKQFSLFESDRLTLDGAIELAVASLLEYACRYQHWVIAYSGGKDSSATVLLVVWAIKSGLVPAPSSLTVLYADTRMEIPPLQATALQLLEQLRGDGFNAQVVLPELDERFFVYMFGRGVPPPKNRFRWCTGQIKVQPMHAAIENLPRKAGEKLLMITGVRLGESQIRDQRIALSCSKDSGECGQGWFQISPPDAVADTLAPIVHWRVCHVYDWIYFEQHRHGYDVSDIAAVYGDSDVRTGCAGCNLVNRDIALERLVKMPEWEHLGPLLELKPLYRELTKARWRKRKSQPETRKDGQFSKNVQRLGPLTMEARAFGLDRVLDIQERARVDLINAKEEARIRELWALDTWPNGWDGSEVRGNDPIDAMGLTSDGVVIVQPLLVR